MGNKHKRIAWGILAYAIIDQTACLLLFDEQPMLLPLRVAAIVACAVALLRLVGKIDQAERGNAR